MVERLYSTTECNKLIIGCCDRIGIGGLTLRVFISHSRLSRVSERQVKFVVKYTLSSLKGEKYYTDIFPFGYELISLFVGRYLWGSPPL